MKTGYPIAFNIRKKMPASHNLIVMDLNKEAVNNFVEKIASFAKSGDGASSMLVETCDNAREIAARCVRLCFQFMNRGILLI
jgi:hypothetical protein